MNDMAALVEKARKKITMKELADKVGCSVRTLYNYLDGTTEARPSKHFVKKLERLANGGA